jgi:hypothetical protein
MNNHDNDDFPSEFGESCFKKLREYLRWCVDQHGFGDILVFLSHICVDEALRDVGLDGADPVEATEMIQRLKKQCHYGTPLGRAAEWIKMADRIYALSFYYNPEIKCPDFTHPPFLQQLGQQ